MQLKDAPRKSLLLKSNDVCYFWQCLHGFERTWKHFEVKSVKRDIFTQTSHSKLMKSHLNNHLIFCPAVSFIFGRGFTFNFPEKSEQNIVTYRANYTGCSHFFFVSWAFAIHGWVNDWGPFTHPRGHEMITSSYAWTVRTFVVITDSCNVNTNDSRFSVFVWMVRVWTCRNKM